MGSLIHELYTIEDARSAGVATCNTKHFTKKWTQSSCILCKTAHRPHTNHNIIDCYYLPETDRQDLLDNSWLVSEDYSGIEEPEDFGICAKPIPQYIPRNCQSPAQYPFLNTFYNGHQIHIKLSTGATINLIRASSASAFGIPVQPTSQTAQQIGGSTPLDVVGEVHCYVTRGSISFQLDALVVTQLDIDVLAGNQFMATNDIEIWPAKGQIIIGDSEIVLYGPHSLPEDPISSVRYTQSYPITNPGYDLSTPVDIPSQAILSKYALKPETPWPQPLEVFDPVACVLNDTHTHVSPKQPEDMTGVSFVGSIIHHSNECTLQLQSPSDILSCTVYNDEEDDVRDSLIIMCREMCTLSGSGITVHVDPVPEFVALVNDNILQSHGITIRIEPSPEDDVVPMPEYDAMSPPGSDPTTTVQGAPLSRSEDGFMPPPEDDHVPLPKNGGISTPENNPMTPPGDGPMTPPGDGPMTPPEDGPITPPGDGPMTPPEDGPMTPPGDGPMTSLEDGHMIHVPPDDSVMLSPEDDHVSSHSAMLFPDNCPVQTPGNDSISPIVDPQLSGYCPDIPTTITQPQQTQRCTDPVSVIDIVPGYHIPFLVQSLLPYAIVHAPVIYYHELLSFAQDLLSIAYNVTFPCKIDLTCQLFKCKDSNWTSNSND